MGLLRRRMVWLVAPVILVLLVVAYGLISFLIARGVTQAERKPQEEHPSDYGLTYEDVEFPSRRGDVTLSGWRLPADSNMPTIIFVHGIGSVRSGDNAVELASRLVGEGYNLLLFDLRGHGSSGGDKVSGGFFERYDLWGAYDYLIGQGIEASDIGLIGFSMGAATSVMAAAEEPGINSVVADSPYAVASDLIAREAARKTPIPLWVMPVFIPTARLMADSIYGIDIGSLVPEKSVALLNYPILVIHGTDDQRVPIEQGRRVADAAPEGSFLWPAEGVDHVDAFKTYPDEYVARVVEYLETRFP